MEDDGFLQDLLAANPEKFGDILRDPCKYRFQVLLSYHRRESSGKSTFVRHGYRVDREYFYPASTIKLAVVVAALEKLKESPFTEGKEFHFGTPMSFPPLLLGDKVEKGDETNLYDQKITLAHTIRKLFLVSDNQAFNRLYALVGHRTLNETMWAKGLTSVRLHGRLSVSLSSSINHCCEPIEVDLEGGSYSLSPKRSTLVLPDNAFVPGVLVGKAFLDDDGKLIGEPKDFSQKNRMSLLDLQQLLLMLVRPDLELGTSSLNIDEDQRSLVLEAMCQYPSTSCNPHFDAAAYPDDYCKFFLPGIARVRSKGAIRIYSKIGRAYGFTIENSYIIDIETGKSFFLAAVVYTNQNEILNDDRYEYEDADRVLADVGEVIATALWQVPSTATNTSTSRDRTPSSLWSDAAHSCLQSALKLSACGSDDELTVEPPGVPSLTKTDEASEGRKIVWPYNYCVDE